MKKKKKQLMTTYKVVKGNVFSTVMSVTGAMLLIIFVIPLMLTMPDLVQSLMTTGSSGELIWTIFYGIFTIIGGGMLYKGSRLRGRTRRYKRYDQVIGHQEEISVAQIAQLTNKSPKYVLRDIKKMVDDQLIHDGYLDRDQGILIIGQDNYLAYMNKQQQLAQQSVINYTGDDQIDHVIKNGKQTLDELNQLAQAIGHPIIVGQIGSIANTTKSIFKLVVDHPEKINDIRRFMEYYLPTTLKLLHAYKRYQLQTSQGDNITQAMDQIETMLTTINDAFNRLLDNLYQDDTLDIMTDMTALEAMLAQEGLTKNKFTINT